MSTTVQNPTDQRPAEQHPSKQRPTEQHPTGQQPSGRPTGQRQSGEHSAKRRRNMVVAALATLVVAGIVAFVASEAFSTDDQPSTPAGQTPAGGDGLGAGQQTAVPEQWPNAGVVPGWISPASNPGPAGAGGSMLRTSWRPESWTRTGPLGPN